LRAFRGVLGLPNVSVEDPDAIVAAIVLFERGVEFADALHVASGARADSFATFDRQLVARAKGVAPITVIAA
jgi:predicted nucleic acid-binding protein